MHLATFLGINVSGSIGAFIIGKMMENMMTDMPPNVSRIMDGYGTGYFIGTFIGGLIVGSLFGLLCIGIVRELLGLKTWQDRVHNFYAMLAGLLVGTLYGVLVGWGPLMNGESVSLSRYHTHNQAARWLDIFCLPSNLPDDVDPTPIFYEVGDPSIPDLVVLYTNSKSSDLAFMVMVSGFSYRPDVNCEKDFALPNGYQACYDDWSDQPISPMSLGTPIEGPYFITHLHWTAQWNGRDRRYSIESPLTLAETQTIATSFCSK